MADIEYDNEGDQFEQGYDAGVIRDGVVTLDHRNGRYVLVDDDNRGFDFQAALANHLGKKVRFTLISFESLQTLEEMTQAAQQNRPS